jgi:hypothetical protein
MSGTARATAVQASQKERITRLAEVAVQAARDIEALLALNPASLETMSACFGRRYEYLDPHRLRDALRGERVAGYRPAPGAEECPACWVKNGYRTPLALRETLGQVDITECPRCTFCELLPNGKQTEAA